MKAVVLFCGVAWTALAPEVAQAGCRHPSLTPDQILRRLREDSSSIFAATNFAHSEARATNDAAGEADGAHPEILRRDRDGRGDRKPGPDGTPKQIRGEITGLTCDGQQQLGEANAHGESALTSTEQPAAATDVFWCVIGQPQPHPVYTARVEIPPPRA